MASRLMTKVSPSDPMTAEKKCSGCHIVKPITEYYKSGGKCKKCVCSRMALERVLFRERVRLRERKRNQKPSRKEKNRQYSQKLRSQDPERAKRYHKTSEARFPERKRAAVAVNNAVRDGRLVKQPCQVCGGLKVEGHHEDYSKPLEVVWLCRRHHMERHYPDPFAKQKEDAQL